MEQIIMLQKLSIKEAKAFHILKIISADQLVDHAVYWLESGLDTKSLRWLAAELKPILSDVGPLFESVCKELNVQPISDKEAVFITLDYCLYKMVNDKIDEYEVMKYIHLHIYAEYEHLFDKKKHVGECMGIQHLYAWFRELQDAEDDSALCYYTDLPKSDAILKFKQHLKEEAAKVLNQR